MNQSFTKLIQDGVLDEQHRVTPEFLAEAERLQGTGTERVSAEEFINSVLPLSKPIVSKPFRRAETSGEMAWANLYLREAEIKYPHIFAYV